MRRIRFTPSLLSLTLICSCGPSDDPAQAASGDAGPGDSGIDAPPNACPAPSGPGTTHADAVASNTVWRAADGPHLVTFGFTVEQGATLSIEPCAEVRIQSGYGITVKGKLQALGTPTQPIHVLADDVTKPWSYILFQGGSGEIAYTTIENGGSVADPNGLGLIDVRGDTTVDGRQELLRLDNVTLKTSQQFGLSLRDNATLTTDSSAVTVSGAQLGPVRAWPSLAGNIPAGLYAGNGIDEFAIIASASMSQDTTWHDRGIPYRIGDAVTLDGRDMRIGNAAAGSSKVTFSVEAGVTVKVVPTGRIIMSKESVAASGVLVAQGTAARPVVFTSASSTPAAGDWVGLWFDAPDPDNLLENVRVEYAGGPSQASSFHCDQQGGFNEAEDAAILLFGRPSAAFITSSSIAHSAGYGIDRAWSGAELDFLATNTFSQIARCKQSTPRDANGGCPASVPCP